MTEHRFTKRMLVLTAALFGVVIMSVSAQDQNSPVVTDVVTLKTSMGDIVLELYGKDAPKTVANFVGLANQDVYDGVLFHRVVPGFVVQAGDPKTKDSTLKAQWGTGGTSIYDGKEFADELDPDAPSSKRGYAEGTLAMANRGPNTNTSQFFIVTSDGGAKHLPHKYTIFGAVRSGMDVVKAMEKVELDGSVPRNPITILDAEVAPTGGMSDGK